MQTIKTAVVVVMLLVVLYGAYEVINRPEPEMPPSIAGEFDDLPLDPPDITEGFGDPMVESGIQPIAPETGESPFPGDSTGTETPYNPPYARQDGNASGNPTEQAGNGSFVAPDRGSGETNTGVQTPGDPREQQNPYYPKQGAGGPNGTANGPDLNNVGPAPNGTGSTTGVGSATPSYPQTDTGGTGFNAPPNPGEGSAEQAPGQSAYEQPVNSNSTGRQAYMRARRTAERLIEEGKLREALATLSMFYRSPELTAEEQSELLDLLDPLAGKVIYSTEHHLVSGHEVRRNETLIDVAKLYNVPWQLLQKINNVEYPMVLVPGTQLKVIEGPFRAQVYIADRKLVLFVGDLYAGSFNITVGNDPAPRTGKYSIRDKKQDRTYYAADGRTIPGDSPLNPYGNAWLDLGSDYCIHGSARNGGTEGQGCIGLSIRDAEDVYAILSQGSEVTIMP